jgi:hypothetical protein
VGPQQESLKYFTPGAKRDRGVAVGNHSYGGNAADSNGRVKSARRLEHQRARAQADLGQSDRGVVLSQYALVRGKIVGPSCCA